MDFNSEGLDGPALSALYFRSSTGENETDFGDAERVRTDAIPLTTPGVYKQVLVSPVGSRGCTAAGRRLVIFACEMVYLRGRRRVIARSHCELATASRRAIPVRWTSAAVFHNRETSLTSLLHYEKGFYKYFKNTGPDTCVLYNRKDGVLRGRAAPYNTSSHKRNSRAIMRKQDPLVCRRFGQNHFLIVFGEIRPLSNILIL